MTLPPDDPRPTADDPADDPDASALADQPTVAWQPPTPPAEPPPPPVEPPAPPPASGPIISASPVGVVPGAPPAAGAAPVVGWQLPDAGLPPSPVEGYAVAGVGARLGGIMLDWILLAVLTVAVALVIGVVASDAILEDTVALGLLVAIVYTGFEFLYFVGFWTSGRRATPGMRALGLAVTSVDGRGIPITAALVRWFLLTIPVGNLAVVLPSGSEIVSSLVLLWWIVLLLTTGMDPRRRGLHDRWSGTIVIRRVGASSAGVLVGCLVLAILAIALLFIAAGLLANEYEPFLSELGQPI
jgi:uncharacterized RDD family membrane protein YckC